MNEEHHDEALSEDDINEEEDDVDVYGLRVFQVIPSIPPPQFFPSQFSLPQPPSVSSSNSMLPTPKQSDEKELHNETAENTDQEQKEHVKQDSSFLPLLPAPSNPDEQADQLNSPSTTLIPATILSKRKAQTVSQYQRQQHQNSS